MIYIEKKYIEKYFKDIPYGDSFISHFSLKVINDKIYFSSLNKDLSEYNRLYLNERRDFYRNGDSRFEIVLMEGIFKMPYKIKEETYKNILRSINLIEILENDYTKK